MSDRICLVTIKSDVANMLGDAVELWRDNDTKSYRIFTYQGYGERQVMMGDRPIAGHIAIDWDDCTRCNLSLDALKQLGAVIQKAIAEHEPWHDGEDTLD